MTVMLPFATPRIETRFKSPLLSASTRITRQSAANAIRRWWNIGSDRERAALGMVISRSDIINRNNEIGNPIPVALFSSPAPDDHEVILAAFSDQSAVALRARAPGTWSGPQRKGDGGDLFTVFPVVLRLASMARPKDINFLPFDGLGDITLKMQGAKSPILALARKKGEGGWVNAEASWTCEVQGLDESRRAEILIELGRETAAWAALADKIPPLALPENGRAPHGPVSAQRAKQVGLAPGDLVAAPAVLEWAAFSADEAKEMSGFAHDLLRWMQIRTERRWAQIDMDIITAQPRQRPGQDVPKVKISLRGDDILRDGAPAKKRLTDCAMRILRAGEAPLPLERMVGQVERDYRNRRTWIESVTLASRLASSDVSMSNHEVMRLRQRFDPYWA